MTKAQTIWLALLVLAASCLAMAEQPVVWYPAQQAPDSQSAPSPSGQAGQQPSTSSGQPQGGQQPAQQPGAQPPAEGTAPGGTNDPRVDQPTQPIGPAEPAPTTTEPTSGQAVILPDTTPLNSPRDLTLGTPSESTGRSYMMPSLRFSTSVSATSGIPGVGTEALSNMSGTVNSVHSWAHAVLNFDFTAGGNLYSDQTNLNAAFEQYALGLRFNQARWSFSLNDTGSYLPASGFGFYGTQFLGGGGLGPGYLPNQSIYTEGSRLSNTVGAETVFQLSPKSSLHFSGSWGILRFQGVGLENDSNYDFVGGYDHKIGGVSTIGASYSASLYSYGGGGRTIDAHTISLSYGRRVTGKLALQVSAGPEIRVIDDPLLGAETDVSWFLRTGLTFQTGRFLWSSSFTHYASGGSGVLGGADTWQWDLSTSRNIGRQWQSGAHVGIARNSSIFNGGLAQNTFNYQFAGVQLSRVLSREWSLFFNYNLQHQTSDLPLCAGCSDSYTRHIVGIGFEWHGRPMTGWF